MTALEVFSDSKLTFRNTFCILRIFFGVKFENFRKILKYRDVSTGHLNQAHPKMFIFQDFQKFINNEEDSCRDS